MSGGRRILSLLFVTLFIMNILFAITSTMGQQAAALTVEVRNVGGLNMPPSGGDVAVHLYRYDRSIGGYVFVTSRSVRYLGGETHVTVTFTGLLVGEYYWFNVSHRPYTGLRLQEYWGHLERIIRLNTTDTRITFYRARPYITSVDFPQSLAVNQQFNAVVRVKNADIRQREVFIRIIVDRDRAEPFDVTRTTGTITLSPNEEKDFIVTLSLSSEGTYYPYAIVYLRDARIIYDQWDGSHRPITVTGGQQYYLRVDFSSSVVNGRALSGSNPEIVVRPGDRINGYLEVVVDNNRGGSWLTPVIGTASWTRGQFACITGNAPTGRSAQRYNFELTAPTQPGTYYIGVFTGWMHNCNEVASNDSPSRFGDGDDVWDMPQQGWEEVIRGGQALTGAYRLPGRAIKIVVISAPQPTGDQYEPDNIMQQSKEIRTGERQRRSILPAGDIDWVMFSLTQRSRVVIETSGPSGDTILELYDATGTYIAEDDDSGEGFWSRIEVELNAGTYYIRVREFGNDESIPEYYLSLTVTPVTQQVSVDVWTDKGGQGRGNLDGGQYTVGESITFYCSVNINVDRMRVIVIRPDGTRDTVYDAGRSAGTHSFPSIVGPPPGGRRVICEAWRGDQYSSDEVRFNAVEAQTPLAQLVSISTDKSQYVVGEVVRIPFIIRNTGNVRLELRVILEIRDPRDNLIYDSHAAGEDKRYVLGPGEQASGEFAWRIPPNAPAGTYRIAVSLRDWNNWNIIYDYRWGDKPGPTFTVITAPVGDIYEPDNTVAQAKEIKSGESQRRSINPIGEVDWARFTLPQRSRVIITTTGPSGDTVLELFNSAGVRLVMNDDYNGTLWSRIEIELDPGTYYIRVTEYGNNDRILEYYLGLTVIPVQLFDFGVNVSPQIQTIHTGGSATYTISVELISGAPQQVTLSVSGLPSGAIGSFDLASGMPTFTSKLLIRTASTTPPGQYTITITASGGGRSKEIRVTLFVIPAAGRLNVMDVAISSRHAYFRLESPVYSDLISEMRDELRSMIGPGLRYISIHSIKVRIEAPSGVQMIVLPLTKQLNVGQRVMLFAVGQLISQIPLAGLVWDFFELIFDVFRNLDEVKPVNVYEFTNSYPGRHVDEVINSLLNKRDKYLIYLKSTHRRSEWSITFNIIVTYSLDYSGTVIPTHPPGRELTWSRQITVTLTEE